MDAILEMLSRGVEQLLARASGPLNFRLFVMPTVVSIIAIRAGLRDAREGRPAFLWAILTNSTERRGLFRSALKDIGRVIIMALVMDTTYQLLVLREFHVLQLLIVIVTCAILPYVLIRGPVTRVTRGSYKKQDRLAQESAAKTMRDSV